jgi:beta-lactamase class A
MGGSTYIDQFPTGTQFTVEELMEYAIRYSDNTAYYMLNKEFGFESFNAYAKKLGIQANEKRGLTLQFSKPRFGYLSARDVGLYFEDISKFIDEGTPESKKLYSWLITTTEQSQFPAAFNAKIYNMSELRDDGKLNTAYTSRFEGYTIGHKYGVQDYGEAWNRAYHDGAIVWCEHPYVLVITSNLPTQTEESNKVFHDIAELVDKLQREFYRN